MIPSSKNNIGTASCCMQIVIWDGATGAKVKELEGHSSYVKGIAWDPVGTYLASQVRPAVQQQQKLQHTLNHVQFFSWTCLWAECPEVAGPPADTLLCACNRATTRCSSCGARRTGRPLPESQSPSSAGSPSHSPSGDRIFPATPCTKHVQLYACMQGHCHSACMQQALRQGQVAWQQSMDYPKLSRLCWAPDGCAVVGVNSFQSPKHTAVVLQRGTWGQGDRVPDYLVGAWGQGVLGLGQGTIGLDHLHITAAAEGLLHLLETAKHEEEDSQWLHTRSVPRHMCSAFVH
jgi:hypothetical protein